MFLGILHRTVFFELAKVFVLSLVGITSIIVMAAIVVEAQQRGLGPGQILAAIPLIVPSMMPFIIPPTTLFATCVVYGRLSHDNEIIAIKAAGINIVYLVWPGVFLGAAMSVATMGLYYHTIPYTHYLLRAAVVNDVEDFLYATLKRDRELRARQPGKMGYDIFVEQVQGRQLRQATFIRRDAKNVTDVIARAREAELHVDLKKREIVVHMIHCDVFDNNGKVRAHDGDRSWDLPLEGFDRIPKFSPRDMTWQQLQEKRVELHGKEDNINATVGIMIAHDNVVKFAPGDLPKHLAYHQSLKKEVQSQIRAIDAEMQMRPALSAGCLFFVLVGCPVGIWFSKSDYLSAFITCFLPIVFLYYPLQLCGTNLAKDGRLAPSLALWMANSAMALMALLLFRRLLRN